MDSKCSWRSTNCSIPPHRPWHMQTTGMGIHHAKMGVSPKTQHQPLRSWLEQFTPGAHSQTTKQCVPPCSMRRAAATMSLEVHTNHNPHQVPPGSRRKAEASASTEVHLIPYHDTNRKPHQVPPGSRRKAEASASTEVHLIPYHAAAPPDKTGASNVPPQAEPAEPTTKPRSQEARTPLYTPIQPTPTCQSSACTTCGRNRAAPPRPRRGRVQRASSQDSTTHRRNSEHSSKQATARTQPTEPSDEKRHDAGEGRPLARPPTARAARGCAKQ